MFIRRSGVSSRREKFYEMCVCGRGWEGQRGSGVIFNIAQLTGDYGINAGMILEYFNTRCHKPISR